jgi:hypothetical protein
LQLRAFTFARTAVSDHRLPAASLALLIHVALAAAILSLPSAPDTAPSRITEVVLIPSPIETESAPPTDPVDEDSAQSEPVDEPVAVDAPAETLPSADQPAVSAQAAPADADDQSDSPDAYALSPGTRSVLQGLQCPGDPETFARTGLCPQSARNSGQLVAADPSASDFFAIDTAAIRARFGIAPHALSGQATLDAGQRRGALANSDSIRDALPASRPDPAFGD